MTRLTDGPKAQPRHREKWWWNNMLVIELMRSVNYENGKKGYTSKEKYPEAKKG